MFEPTSDDSTKDAAWQEAFNRHPLQRTPRREPCSSSFRCRCPWHQGPNPVGENMRGNGHHPWGWCEECCLEAKWQLWDKRAFDLRTPQHERIRLLRAMGYSQFEAGRIVGITQQRVSQVEKNLRLVSSCLAAGYCNSEKSGL